MNCDKAGNLIMKYFDGELGDNETSLIKDHMNLCENCSREFEALQGILDSVYDVEAVEPPEDFEASVMQKISNYELLRKKRRERFLAFLYSWFTISTVITALMASYLINNSDINIILEKFGAFSETARSILQAVQNGYIFVYGIMGGLIKALLIIARSYYSMFALLTGSLIMGYSILTGQTRSKEEGAK